jgi:hypothetical protein
LVDHVGQVPGADVGHGYLIEHVADADPHRHPDIAERRGVAGIRQLVWTVVADPG